jgi:hypothetical protein
MNASKNPQNRMWLRCSSGVQRGRHRATRRSSHPKNGSRIAHVAVSTVTAISMRLQLATTSNNTNTASSVMSAMGGTTAIQTRISEVMRRQRGCGGRSTAGSHGRAHAPRADDVRQRRTAPLINPDGHERECHDASARPHRSERLDPVRRDDRGSSTAVTWTTATKCTLRS